MTFWLRTLMALILFAINIAVVLVARWFVVDVLRQPYDLTMNLAIFAIWLASTEGAHRIMKSEKQAPADGGSNGR